MPIFEYKCKSCGITFEKLVPRVTDELYLCPECNSKNTEKKLSAFGGILTGNSKLPCSSAPTCQSMGTPCCDSGKCPMR